MAQEDVLTPEDVKELAPLYENVVLALKQVYDPEIPVNIYDLGLIYELHISKEHEVSIKMTFTAPTCPMADEVVHEVEVLNDIQHWHEHELNHDKLQVHHELLMLSQSNPFFIIIQFILIIYIIKKNLVIKNELIYFIL